MKEKSSGELIDVIKNAFMGKDLVETRGTPRFFISSPHGNDKNT